MNTTVKFLFSTLVAAAAMTSTAWAEGTTIDTTKFYINEAYSGEVEGEDLGNGKYWGVNAFSSLGAAIAKKTSDTEEFVVESDIDGDSISSLGGIKVTTSAENGVTINNVHNNWVYVSGNAQIGAGVTINSGYYFYYGTNVIDGKLVASGQNYHRYDNVTTVSAGGFIACNGEAFVIRYNTENGSTGGFKLIGDAEQGASLEDRKAQMHASYYSFYSGTIDASDTLITGGLIGMTNTADGSSGKAIANLNNTIWTSKGNLKMSGNATINLDNGSVLEVTDVHGHGDSVLDATSKIDATDSSLFFKALNNSGKISLDNSTFTAGKLVNNGTLKLSGASTLKANSVKSSTDLLFGELVFDEEGKEISGAVVNNFTFGSKTEGGVMTIDTTSLRVNFADVELTSDVALSVAKNGYFVTDTGTWNLGGNELKVEGMVVFENTKFENGTVTIDSNPDGRGGNSTVCFQSNWKRTQNADGSLGWAGVVDGAVVIADTATVNITNTSHLTIYSDTVINGTLNVENSNNGVLIGYNAGEAPEGVEVTVDGGKFTVAGTVNVGTVANSTESVLNIQNGSVASFGKLVSNGNVVVDGNSSLALVKGGSLAGTLKSDGEVTIGWNPANAAVPYVDASLKVSGTLDAKELYVYVNSDLAVEGGSLNSNYLINWGEISANNAESFNVNSLYLYGRETLEGTNYPTGDQLGKLTLVGTDATIGRLQLGRVDSASNTVMGNASVTLTNSSLTVGTLAHGTVSGNEVQTIVADSASSINLVKGGSLAGTLTSAGTVTLGWDPANAEVPYVDATLNVSGALDAKTLYVYVNSELAIQEGGSLNSNYLINWGEISAKNAESFNVNSLYLYGRETLEGTNYPTGDQLGKLTLVGTDATIGRLQLGRVDSVSNTVMGNASVTLTDSSLTVGTLAHGTVSGNEVQTITLDNSTLKITGDAQLAGSLSLTNSTLVAGTFTNNGTVEVYGESTLNIGTFTGKEEISFCDGAIIKNSTIGGGVFVAGNVTFRGQNTFAMLYDYGTLTDYYGTTAPMEWTVEKGASLVLTNTARYGLGYGDKVTINGSLTDAKTARGSLTEADRSLFMHGLVAQESKGWNCESKFTVKDAYVHIGSNSSFGNKPGNYGGSYEFYFENSVLDASRITFYEALSTTTFTFKGCDVKLGTFMTRDKDSVFTLDNTKLLSTTTTNGSDEGNYNAGTLNVINGSELTYSALLSNEVGGTINVVDSTLTVLPGIKNDSKIVVSNSTLRAGNIVNNGTIYVEGDNVTSWESNVSGTGAIYVGKDDVTGADNLGSTMKIVGDKSISGSKLYVDDGAVLKIEEGNSLSFSATSGGDDYKFLVVGGNLDVAGGLTVDGCSIRFSRAKNTTISGTANFDGQTCIYGSNVTVTGELNITHGQNMGDSLIIGYSKASSIGNIDTTATLVVSGEGAKVTVNGGDWKPAAVTKIYTDENGKVGTLTVENGAAFETDGSIESSGIINVDNGSLSVAGTITNNYWLLVQNGGSLSANKIVNNDSFDIYNSTLENQTISGNGYVYAENAQFNNVSVSGNDVYMMGTNVNGGSFGTVYSGYGVVDGEWATAANAKSVISGNVTSGDWYNYGQLTVSEGATMKVGYYGDTASGSTTVNGTVEATTYRSYNGTVGANGKIVADYVNLYGNANSQKHYEIAGTVTAKTNLLIGFDSIYQGEWHIGGANTVVTVSGENAKLEALSDATIHADDAGKKATLNVVNGGKVIVEGTLTNNGSINVDSGTLTAVTIVNNGSITLNNATFNVTNLTGTGTLTMLGDSHLTDGSGESSGVEIDSIVVKTESNSVALSASAGTIVFGGVREVTKSANTEITLEANQGVVIAWHFDVDVSGIEENQSVTVETNIGAGFSTSEIQIFHKEDGASEWTNANVSDVAYDKETGKLSFKADSFSSYAVVVPEPSMFGLFAGLGALLLVGTRRRRK